MTSITGGGQSDLIEGQAEMVFGFTNNSGEDVDVSFNLFDGDYRIGSVGDVYTIPDAPPGDVPYVITIDLSGQAISPGVYPNVQISNLGDGEIRYELQ
ncbi:MAG TPA: hypothetical protein VG738_19560 [Chitinophagaceae bacterium]|nr:hypothetical protein [Chitinophagaceae bacterium]